MRQSRAAIAIAPPGDFTTSFPATENPISQSSIWTNGETDGSLWQDVRTTPALAFGSGYAGDQFEGSAFDDNIAHLKTSYRTFSANQFVQGVIHYGYSGLPQAAHEVELLGRFSISNGVARGYEAICGVGPDGPYAALVKWDGDLGDFKAIYDPGANSITLPAEDNVFRLELTDSTGIIKYNGSTLVTADLTKEVGGGTIAVWGSGQPGIGFWPVRGTGQDPAKFGWKSITAGDL